MYSSSSTAALGGLLVLYIVLFIAVLVAYIMLIAWLIRIAREKGCDMSNGVLWFIGLFTTPIALGVAVAALPDRRQAADALPGQSQEVNAPLFQGQGVNTSLFQSLGVAAPAPAIVGEERGPVIESASGCPVVTMGSCEQGGGTSAPIEWYVLEKHDDGTALLLSKNCLANRPYHNKSESVTWASCDLRAWLNGEFFQNSFSAEERERVLSAHLENSGNPQFGTSGGEDTDDKVFLLSQQEIKQYFGVSAGKASGSLVAYPTAHAVSQGTYTGDGGASYWWLRTPGRVAWFASYVNAEGLVTAGGWDVERADYAVRPACWVKLDS